MNTPLVGKTILITGAARRVGRILALACANAGANVAIHHGHSDDDAEDLRAKLTELGCKAWVFECPRYITGEIVHLDGGRHLV